MSIRHNIAGSLLLAGLSALSLSPVFAQAQKPDTPSAPDSSLGITIIRHRGSVPASLIEASNKANQLNLRGEALLKANDADAALACFQEASAAEPVSSRACLGAAEAYTLKGHLNEAVGKYRSFFYDWPKGWGSSEMADTSYLMKFALVLLKTGQRAEALKEYQVGYSHLPTDRGPLPPLFTAPDFKDADFESAAYTAMGIWITVSYDPNGGEADFERAIATQPTIAVPYYYRGTILMCRKGRAQDALEAFGQAQRLGDASLQPFVDRALRGGSDEFSKAVKKAKTEGNS